jgi:hypothetical protein
VKEVDKGLLKDWQNIRYLHIPTGGIYKLTGASTIIRTDESTNTTLPMWIIDGSKDFEEVGVNEKYNETEIGKMILAFADKLPIDHCGTGSSESESLSEKRMVEDINRLASGITDYCDRVKREYAEKFAQWTIKGNWVYIEELKYWRKIKGDFKQGMLTPTTTDLLDLFDNQSRNNKETIL